MRVSVRVAAVVMSGVMLGLGVAGTGAAVTSQGTCIVVNPVEGSCQTLQKSDSINYTVVAPQNINFTVEACYALQSCEIYILGTTGDDSVGVTGTASGTINSEKYYGAQLWKLTLYGPGVGVLRIPA
jgi:hypothetical protein